MILGYVEDGPDLVSLAMNGWGAANPAWWLNLQSQPEAVVELRGGERRAIRGRAAVGEERVRLWQQWQSIDSKLDGLRAYNLQWQLRRNRTDSCVEIVVSTGGA